MQTIDAIYADQYVYIDELKHVKLRPEQALPKDQLLSKDEVKSMKAIMKAFMEMLEYPSRYYLAVVLLAIRKIAYSQTESDNK